MTNVLLFEWLTGGGLWEEGATLDPNSALQRQGRQMLVSLVSDFLKSGARIITPIDSRLNPWGIHRPAGLEVVSIGSNRELWAKLEELAQSADRIMLIAPECDSILLRCVQSMHGFQHKLFSPNSRFVEITSCKMATIAHLQGRGFAAVPSGMRLTEYLARPKSARPGLPAVIKPVDGAGSDGVCLFHDWAELNRQFIESPERYRIESYITGTPVSVSVLCGEICQILAPTGQVFDQQPIGHYVNASYPLDAVVSERAIRLAARVLDFLPRTVGYIGLDMIISDRDDPHDCLIEVNPRLTMSYLKLREIYDVNLAELMLETAHLLEAATANESSPEGDHRIRVINPRCIFRAPSL